VFTSVVPMVVRLYGLGLAQQDYVARFKLDLKRTIEIAFFQVAQNLGYVLVFQCHGSPCMVAKALH